MARHDPKGGKRTGNTMEIKGEQCWEYEDARGKVWRRANGTVAKLSEEWKEGVLSPMDSERSIELHAIKKEKYRSEAKEGLRRAIETRRGKPVTDSAEAFGLLVETQVEMADSPELGMAAVKSFQNVERVVGLDEKAGGPTQAVQVNINVDGALLDRIQELGGEVIDIG